jgi:Lipopolysaccharide kinase (Kdo/WaaP) family
MANQQFTIGGWQIEPVARWPAIASAGVEQFGCRVVSVIDETQAGLYYRSRHAVTYLTQIANGNGAATEFYVKAYDAPRGLAALKGRIRGGRAGNALRMTQALNRAGFNTPPMVLKGVHAATGRTMLTSVRAEGTSLPELIASMQGGQSLVRKRALLRALGVEVARLHRAGFVHGDMTPYNIFVVQDEPPRFIFLDHDRTRLGFPAGRRYRQLRNLVQLGCPDLPGLSNTDRLRVFRAYAAAPGAARYRTALRRVARMLARRRRRDAQA